MHLEANDSTHEMYSPLCVVYLNNRFVEIMVDKEVAIAAARAAVTPPDQL